MPYSLVKKIKNPIRILNKKYKKLLWQHQNLLKIYHAIDL